MNTKKYEPKKSPRVIAALREQEFKKKLLIGAMVVLSPIFFTSLKLLLLKHY